MNLDIYFSKRKEEGKNRVLIVRVSIFFFVGNKMIMIVRFLKNGEGNGHGIFQMKTIVARERESG